MARALKAILEKGDEVVCDSAAKPKNATPQCLKGNVPKKNDAENVN